jgi:hypothetical protein
VKVYMLKPDPDRYQALALLREEEWDRLLDWFTGEPIGPSWLSPAVSVLREKPSDDRLLVGDFPSLGGVIPVFSGRAVEALGELLRASGEILPLSCAGGTYLAYNVTRVVNALDVERSEVKRFAEGGIMRIIRHEFRPDRLADEVVFKLPDVRKSAVYVTDEFVERVKNADLTGFQFPPVWAGASA